MCTADMHAPGRLDINREVILHVAQQACHDLICTFGSARLKLAKRLWERKTFSLHRYHPSTVDHCLQNDRVDRWPLENHHCARNREAIDVVELCCRHYHEAVVGVHKALHGDAQSGCYLACCYLF